MIPAEPPSRTWVWAAATHVMAARQVGDDATALRVARQALEVAERIGAAVRSTGAPEVVLHGSAEAVANIRAVVEPGVPAVLLANHGVLDRKSVV